MASTSLSAGHRIRMTWRHRSTPGRAVGALALLYSAVEIARQVPYAAEEETPGHARCSGWSAPCSQETLDAHVTSGTTAAYVTIGLVVLALTIDAALASRATPHVRTPASLRALAGYAVLAVVGALYTTWIALGIAVNTGNWAALGLAGGSLVLAQFFVVQALRTCASPARARVAGLCGIVPSIAFVIALFTVFNDAVTAYPTPAWVIAALVAIPTALTTTAAVVGARAVHRA